MINKVVGALYNAGAVLFDSPLSDNHAAVTLKVESGEVDLSLFVEKDAIYVVEHIMAVQADAKNAVGIYVLAHELNFKVLEENGLPGRVMVDARDECDVFRLVYSCVSPAFDNEDACADMILAAADAIGRLMPVVGQVEEHLTDGFISVDTAFLSFLDDSDEEEVKIKFHPSLKLLKMPEAERTSLLQFFEKNNISVDNFSAVQLEIYPVITDTCALYMSNGSGGSWLVEQFSLPLPGRISEIERLIEHAYMIYRAACQFLSLEPISIDTLAWDIGFVD